MTVGTTGIRQVLRTLALPVLLPTSLAYLGQGAVLPVLVLSARHLGASTRGAALLVAVLALGQLLGSAPAGVIAVRVGDRRVLLGAAAVLALCWSVAAQASSYALLVVAVGLAGFATASFDVARQSAVAGVVPRQLRARAMSTLGGVGRIGLLVGPLLGAAAQTVLGLHGSYLVAAVASAAAAVPLLLDRGQGFASMDYDSRKTRDHPVSMAVVARRNRRTLLAWGSGAAVIGAARGVRPVLLPLFALSAGLSPASSSLLFALTGAAELALFYPAGSVMDRYGRAWVAVPCALVMALGLLVLPLGDGTGFLVLGALLLGVGSGLGSGIVKTLGADLAPVRDRATFLGLWTLLAQIGTTGAPTAVAALAGISLRGASVASGLTTVAGAGWLAWLFRSPGSRVRG